MELLRLDIYRCHSILAYIFKDSLCNWNKKPDANKTWDACKTFFHKEHFELDKVNALSKQESVLNHTALFEQQADMFQQIEEQLKLNFITTINNMAMNIVATDEETPHAGSKNIPTATISEKHEDTTAVTSALSTITNNSSKQTKEILQLFNGLSKKLDNLEQKCTVSTKENTRPPNINPTTGRPWRRYCWTCGCCDHWGRFCPNRKPGHKVDATFKNRMGGSTKGVIGA